MAEKKKAKPIAATQLTLQRCRKRGWTVDKTEQVVPTRPGQRPRKRDLFGFGDALALNPAAEQAFLIQATSRGNIAARARKICSELYETASLAMACKIRVQIWGWDRIWRKTKAGGKVTRNRVKIVEILEVEEEGDPLPVRRLIYREVVEG